MSSSMPLEMALLTMEKFLGSISYPVRLSHGMSPGLTCWRSRLYSDSACSRSLSGSKEEWAR